MKAVTWLLNENNWKDIKTNLKDGVAKKLNYIVGAPSLEMMMDSYNTHYGLKGERPVLGDIEVGRERKKLFYKYENDAKGYLVGPATAAEYSNDFTASYTVQSDDKIDSMYYPNDNKNYWLASPAAYFSDLQYRVYLVHSTKGGIVYHNYAVDGRSGFCPLASLKPSFELELEGNIE